MNYSIFLFSQLFMEYVNKDYFYSFKEYDLIYPKVIKHFENFIISPYSRKDEISEHESIIQYLDHIKLIFELERKCKVKHS